MLFLLLCILDCGNAANNSAEALSIEFVFDLTLGWIVRSLDDFFLSILQVNENHNHI